MGGVDEITRELEGIVGSSSFLKSDPLGPLECGGRSYAIPCYRFFGPAGGGDRIDIGVFAGIHGDERAGAYAVLELLRRLVSDAELARGYQLHCYPVCNPAGFDAGTRLSCAGKDLNREFWTGSAEPEVGLLEAEIRAVRFDGLISLHSDDTSDGIYGYVRGAVLTRGLLEPALSAAEKVLPRNLQSVIDGFPADNGIISDCFDGILTSPPDLNPLPFEIILETPQTAPEEKQIEAFVVAIESVLREYQRFLAFATNL